MKTLSRSFAAIVVLVSTLACGSKHDRNSVGTPSVGKSVGGDSAINAEKSRPIRNLNTDQAPADTPR